MNFALLSVMWSLPCVAICKCPQLLIYTAMSLDYTTEYAALASQSSLCAAAHKTQSAVEVVSNYSAD